MMPLDQEQMQRLQTFEEMAQRTGRPAKEVFHLCTMEQGYLDNLSRGYAPSEAISRIFGEIEPFWFDAWQRVCKSCGFAEAGGGGSGRPPRLTA